MKHYPKGRSAATPKIKETTASGKAFYLVDGKRLTTIMVRAYERHLRWVRFRVATRNGITSPFALARIRRLTYWRDWLTMELAPFRATRPGAHADLALLLDDPESLHVVRRQVYNLQQQLVHLAGHYLSAHNWLERFRPGYYASPPARQERLQTVFLPYLTHELLNELHGLHAEAQDDLQALKALRPALFPNL